MKIDANVVVSLEYTLSAHRTNEPETLVEQTDTEHPFVFLFGHHGVLPEFEKQLLGKTGSSQHEQHHHSRKLTKRSSTSSSA